MVLEELIATSNGRLCHVCHERLSRPGLSREINGSSLGMIRPSGMFGSRKCERARAGLSRRVGRDRLKRENRGGSTGCCAFCRAIEAGSRVRQRERRGRCSCFALGAWSANELACRDGKSGRWPGNVQSAKDFSALFRSRIPSIVSILE